eukprot:807897_1
MSDIPYITSVVIYEIDVQMLIEPWMMQTRILSGLDTCIMNMRKRSDIDLLRTYYIQKEAQRIKVGAQMEGHEWRNGSASKHNANKLALTLHLKDLNKKKALDWVIRYCTVFKLQIKPVQ